VHGAREWSAPVYPYGPGWTVRPGMESVRTVRILACKSRRGCLLGPESARLGSRRGDSHF
jgi:hypothetical protein